MKTTKIYSSIVFTLLFIFFFQNSYSQGFQNLYGKNLEEDARGMTVTSSGDIVFTGITHKNGQNFPDILLTKTDAQGNEAWSKSFSTSLTDIGHAVIETSDGGFMIAGQSAGLGSGATNGLLIKTGSDGSFSWAEGYGDIFTDIFYDVVENPGKGYVAAGTVIDQSTGGVTSDMYIVSVDTAGNVEWTKTYGGNANDEARAIHRVSDGYIVAGYTESFGANGKDIYVIKIDSLGNKTWSKHLKAAGDDIAHDIAEDGSNNLFLTGETNASANTNTSDKFLIRLTSAGVPTTLQLFENANYDDVGYSVTLTADGGFLIAGGTKGNSPRATYLKLNFQFGVEYYKQYSGDIVYDAALVGSGMVIGVGDLDFSGDGRTDVYFISAVDTTGETAASCTEDTLMLVGKQGPFQTLTPNDTISFVQNVYSGTVSSGNLTMNTGDACNPVSRVRDVRREMTIYPVPAVDLLRIADLNTTEGFTYRILDVQGRQISSGKVPQGREAQINVAGLKEGIYFLEIHSANTIYSAKFLK